MRIAEMVVSGIVATALLDLWQRVLQFATGVPATNWGLGGRWFAHAFRGQLFHEAIARAPAVPNERVIGWSGHYAVGIAFGIIYVTLMRAGFGVEPSLLNGLVFGVASVVVPWFFFMPAMGSGVLGRNTPNPKRACLLAFLAHTIFGLGLAIGARVA